MGSIVIFGPAFGPLVGSAVLQILDWRWIFGVLFLSGITTLFILWFVMPESNPTAQRKPLRLNVIGKDYFAILSNSQFMLNILVFCFAYLGMIAWIVLGPFLVIKEFHYSTSIFSLLQAIVFSSMILAAQIIKHFSEKIGINRLIKSGLLISFIASFIAVICTLLFPRNLLALVLPLSGFIFGSSLAFFPLQRVAIEACTEPMGARMAMLGTIMSLFGVAGSFVLSHLYNGTLIWFAELLLLLSLAIIICYKLSQRLKFR
jgi:predicted MFS family arabinose efflux permease